MGYLFDGANKILSLTAGTVSLDVRDMYSNWKSWVEIGDNSKYLQAFSVVGGDPVDEANGIYVSSYFFLENGWKVKPQEANHKLRVLNGILLTIDGSDPFVQTSGTYNVLVQYSQPVKAETVNIGGGGGGLTTPEHDELFSIRGASDRDITQVYNKIDTISGVGMTKEEHNELFAIRGPDNDTLKVISDQIDNTASQSSVNYVSTTVSGIKIKTDALPSDPPSTADIITIMEQLYPQNIAVEEFRAASQNLIRKVDIDRVDRITYKIKLDTDTDWDSPIASGTLYAWYRVLGDTVPRYMGENA